MQHARFLTHLPHIRSSYYNTHHVGEWRNTEPVRPQAFGMQVVVHLDFLHVRREYLLATSVLLRLVVTACTRNMSAKHLLNIRLTAVYHIVVHAHTHTPRDHNTTCTWPCRSTRCPEEKYHYDNSEHDQIST